MPRSVGHTASLAADRLQVSTVTRPMDFAQFRLCFSAKYRDLPVLQTLHSNYSAQRDGVHAAVTALLAREYAPEDDAVARSGSRRDAALREAIAALETERETLRAEMQRVEKENKAAVTTLGNFQRDVSTLSVPPAMHKRDAEKLLPSPEDILALAALLEKQHQ